MALLLVVSDTVPGLSIPLSPVFPDPGGEEWWTARCPRCDWTAADVPERRLDMEYAYNLTVRHADVAHWPG